MTAPTPNAMPGAQNPTGGTPVTPPPAAAPSAPVFVEPTPIPPAAAPTPPPAAAPPAEPSGDAPPWGSDADFDPSRAWTLIQNLRGENGTLRTQVQAAQPILDEHERQRRDGQTELDRTREDLTTVTGDRDAWRTAAIRAAAENLAGDRFVSAAAAVAMIGDLSGFVNGNTVDTAALQARFDQLAADEPGLIKTPPPQGFTPDRGQGQTGSGSLSVDAQIKAAQDRGDLATAIALKQQKLYQ